MKKSLTKLLARMAKDGDVETVAEFIEEMIEGEAETPAEAVAEAAAEVAAEVAEAAAPAADPVIVEAPEAREITIDEDTLSGIIERLDRLIELLTPAPAGDEDPEIAETGEGTEAAEEVAEVVEEVLEAVEAMEEAPVSAEAEVAELLESVLEPTVSTTLEEVLEGDEGCEDPDETVGKDALAAALRLVRPKLKKMSDRQRKRVCADLAARCYKGRKRRGQSLDALMAKKRTADRSDADLGKRIMAARNPNYQKR